MPHRPNQVLGRPTMSSSGKIVTGTFSTKCFSALAQRSTSGWFSVSLNDSVNRTARSNVTRGGPYVADGLVHPHDPVGGRSVQDRCAALDGVFLRRQYRCCAAHMNLSKWPTPLARHRSRSLFGSRSRRGPCVDADAAPERLVDDRLQAGERLGRGRLEVAQLVHLPQELVLALSEPVVRRAARSR